MRAAASSSGESEGDGVTLENIGFGERIVTLCYLKTGLLEGTHREHSTWLTQGIVVQKFRDMDSLRNSHERHVHRSVRRTLSSSTLLRDVAQFLERGGPSGSQHDGWVP